MGLWNLEAEIPTSRLRIGTLDWLAESKAFAVCFAEGRAMLRG